MSSIDRIWCAATTTTCDIEMDVTLDEGETATCYMYYSTSTAQESDPSPTFDGWTGSGASWTAHYSLGNLHTETRYYILGEIYLHQAQTTLRFRTSFTTATDYSVIGYHTVENITKHEADIKVGVEVQAYGGRTDDYELRLYYDRQNPTTSSQNMTINVFTNNITEIIEKIFNLINLRKNTKYYYQIDLYNINADEVIDSVTGKFKTLGDGFKLWMYLWYRL